MKSTQFKISSCRVAHLSGISKSTRLKSHFEYLMRSKESPPSTSCRDCSPSSKQYSDARNVIERKHAPRLECVSPVPRHLRISESATMPNSSNSESSKQTSDDIAPARQRRREIMVRQKRAPVPLANQYRLASSSQRRTLFLCDLEIWR